jgi:hypothetical protein
MHADHLLAMVKILGVTQHIALRSFLQPLFLIDIHDWVSLGLTVCSLAAMSIMSVTLSKFVHYKYSIFSSLYLLLGLFFYFLLHCFSAHTLLYVFSLVDVGVENRICLPARRQWRLKATEYNAKTVDRRQ